MNPILILSITDLTPPLKLAVTGLAPLLAIQIPTLLVDEAEDSPLHVLFVQAKRQFALREETVISHLKDPMIGWATSAVRVPHIPHIEADLSMTTPVIFGDDPLNEIVDAYCGKPNLFRVFAIEVLSQWSVSRGEMTSADAARYYEDQLVTGVALERWINSRVR
jgi:hypothetical protein